jgi:hypothetical protein
VRAETQHLDLIEGHHQRSRHPTISDPLVKQGVDVFSPKLLIWRPRRDLNPRFGRERALTGLITL